MKIATTRFGQVDIRATDILVIPHGLIGYETCHHWVLLGDDESDAIGWLQSTTHPDLALAVISPRRFVPHYRVRVAPRDLAAVELQELRQAFVLNILTYQEHRITVNLRAPLLINLTRRLARQVITVDDQPIQWELAPSSFKLRKSA